MSRTTYRWRDGDVRDKDGFPLLNQAELAREPQAPQLMRDFSSTGRSYASPITGKIIESRSERREDLIRSGCIEVDPPRKPRGLKNIRFAKKRGLVNQLQGEARERHESRSYTAKEQKGLKLA